MIGRGATRFGSRLLFVVLLVLLAAAARAGGECNGPGACESTEIDASTIVETVIGGNDNLSIGLALSYGMGDVDINEGQNCMGSEQKANVLFGKQQLVLSPWCASLFYELNGKHTFAAKIRCDIPKIRKHYRTPEACVIDQDLSPSKPTSTERAALKKHVEAEKQLSEDLVQSYDLVQQQGAEIIFIREAMASTVDRLNQLTEKLADAPHPTVREQPPPASYSDEQYAAVLVALRGGSEDE